MPDLFCCCYGKAGAYVQCPHQFNCVDCVSFSDCTKKNFNGPVRKNQSCFRCKHTKAIFLGIECVLNVK